MHTINDEKQSLTKCPFCGKEGISHTTCSKCGKNISPLPEEIEVEYKEFTLSEFLEIRKKQEQSAGTGHDGTGCSFHERKSDSSLQKEKSEGVITKNRKYLLIMAFVGFIAGIIGGFFLLQLFIH
jgi:ribosomal protein L32